MAALTKNLADELGPQGVNVTVVHPGLTRTEHTPGTLATMARARGVSVEELERGLQESRSIGRIVTAEEVADVVAFLAGPRSVALNGDRSWRAAAPAGPSTTEAVVHSCRVGAAPRG